MASQKFFTPVFKKKIVDALKLSVGGTAAFCMFNVYFGTPKFYTDFITPLLHKVDPEIAHRLSVVFCGKLGICPKYKNDDRETLKSSIFGLGFNNIIGMAAGYDKNGEAVDSLFQLGFGFVEVGSITPKPQFGNEKPRVFRLESLKAVINRYGFNSDGHDVVYERLIKLDKRGHRKGLLGINIGKNKESKSVDDFVDGVKKFGNIADYLVVNISSPNTPGLRLMQQKQELQELILAVKKARCSLEHKPPILFKLSPDLCNDDLKNIADTVLSEKYKIDGLIISNTTVTRPNENCPYINESGGLSGQPLCKLSTEILKQMAILTKGKIPIIGVGGISSAEDALEKFENGASAIQLYTSLVYEGPCFIEKLKDELEVLLKSKGYRNIEEAIGAKLK